MARPEPGSGGGCAPKAAAHAGVFPIADKRRERLAEAAVQGALGADEQSSAGCGWRSLTARAQPRRAGCVKEYARAACIRSEERLISILILTRNEELDLAGCLASVAWSDDVHVFDSCSTDRTQAIAREAGAHVAERCFDNYAAQRNAALADLPFKHDWIFILDCDERLSPALYEEMKAAIQAAPDDLHAFRVRRNDYFLGKRLKHAQIMPFYTRLVRRGKVQYTREVNEMLEVEGRIGDLQGSFAHYPCSKGLARWVEKHNRYSTMEARIVAEQSFRGYASWRVALLEPDFHKRRRAQKAAFYRMPCRPLVRWAYLMLYRGGVLDGRAGWTYAALQAFYEYLIVLKTRELHTQKELGANPSRTRGAARADLAAGTSVLALAAGDSTLSKDTALHKAS